MSVNAEQTMNEAVMMKWMYGRPITIQEAQVFLNMISSPPQIVGATQEQHAQFMDAFLGILKNMTAAQK